MNMDWTHLIILNIILYLALNIHELELLPPLVLIIILSLNLNNHELGLILPVMNIIILSLTNAYLRLLEVNILILSKINLFQI